MEITAKKMMIAIEIMNMLERANCTVEDTREILCFVSQQTEVNSVVKFEAEKNWMIHVAKGARERILREIRGEENKKEIDTR